MLWSPAIVLLLVGGAFASHHNGYREGKEYTYKVRSRTLAALNSQSKQFTGILMEARLKVQWNGQDTLRAKITQPRYSQIHTRLDDGWDSDIPNINLQNFPLSTEPFEIKMKDGVVRDLIVDKDLKTWEVNILKSIVSQLQVDTQGRNARKSKHDQLPEGKQPFAMFKVMEDSVGGECEVLYDISPLPEHVLRNNPELVPMLELRDDGEIISLVKTKNYSNCDTRVSFHSGLNGREKLEPGSNDNGNYLSRSSVSRVVLTGHLKKYTIQSSVTINKVVLNPDQHEFQQGIVASKMNLTLRSVEDISEEVSSPSKPLSTGNLVYVYNDPFESSSRRKTHKSRDSDSRESREDKKFRRRHDFRNSDESRSDSWYSSKEKYKYDDDDSDDSLQPKPKLTEAPRNPMLAYFIGNNGHSIQKNNRVDVIKATRNIAQDIGRDMQRPDSMPEEQTLEKFTILTSLIRTMSAEQIADAQRELYENRRSSNQLRDKEDQNARRNAWVAFRDAVGQAGTGPALVNVKQWIQSKQIEGIEAANVIDAVGKSTLTPTSEYMDAFFEMATMQMTVDQPFVRNAAILSFADLVRHAIVNKRSAHNRYPVHAFGKFISKKESNLHDKYIPYLTKELKSAIDSGSSKKIQLYIMALGRTAHPRMLTAFEPYLEGKKMVSMYQRLNMVLAMNKLATIYPKVARSVLYKIYSNNADDYEIRTAAVYLLMKTKPSASMLQRMAEYTNFDNSKHVNSAVKTTIKSLAKLEDDDDSDLADAAKAAEPLLTSEDYKPQFSRMFLKRMKDTKTDTGFSIETNFIGSKDEIIPKAVYLNMKPLYRGLQVPDFQFGASVSSIKNLLTFMRDKLFTDKMSKSKDKAEKERFSPENIISTLGIQGDDSEQVEGVAFMNTRDGNYFLSFDNHSLEEIPRKLKEMEKLMKDGKTFNETKLTTYEVAMSFPMETGWPLTFTLKVPTVMSANGKLKIKTESDSESKSLLPKSAMMTGKIRLIYAMKIQKRLSFVVPFESQEYMVGVDRNLQIHLPVRSDIEFDKKKRETVIRLRPIGDEEEYKVLQYKTHPFTSKHDILSLQPVQKDRNTHTIHKDRATVSQIELSDKHNQQRVHFRWERQPGRSDENQANENRHLRDKAMDAARKLVRSMRILYNLNEPEKSEYEKYSVKIASKSDITAEMKISYDSLLSDTNIKVEDYDKWTPKAKVPNLESNLNDQDRKHKLLKEAAKNINIAKADVVDISLDVSGGVQTSVAITAAVGRSNVDERSRLLVFASAKTNDGKDYYLAAGFEAKSPKTDSMDYEETLKVNSPRELDGEILYGKGTDRSNEETQTKIKIEGKAKQTEERKKEIRLSRDAQLCAKDDNQNGNKMTKACQKVNYRASSVDRGEVTIMFDKDQSMAKDMVMSVLDTVESISKDVITVEKDRQDKEDKNKIKMSFEMLWKNKKMDVTVRTPEGKLRFKKIVNPRSNDNDEELDDEMTKNTCSLDKTEAETFDNHRYRLDLGKCWHVAMTANPKNDPDRTGQQLDLPEDMHVTVLTRENENGNKEVKVTLGDKEVELMESSRRILIKVNGNKIEITRKKSFQEKKNGRVLFELLELEDKSVMLISDRYDIKIIYDGSRAMIKAGRKYLDTVRGLCGDNDGDWNNDQKTPKGCLLRKADEFVAMYALINDKHCEGQVRQKAEKAKGSKCHYEHTKLGNIISEKEAGRDTDRSDERDRFSDDEKHCTTHRTKIMKTDNDICFSLRPVPVCSSSCRAKEMKSKKIQFHCVTKSSAAEKVAQRVEKGANPDLSQKSVSRVEELQVPISCRG